jgi:hypothetical protein
MADQVNALIDQALALGFKPEDIKLVADIRSAEPTKQFFLEYLKDPNLSPIDYSVKLQVSNWSSVSAFLAKPSTDEFSAQRITSAMRNEILLALQARDAERLILAMFLAMKGMQ